MSLLLFGPVVLNPICPVQIGFVQAISVVPVLVEKVQSISLVRFVSCLLLLLHIYPDR